MAESSGILFKIKGDSSDAVRALKDAGVAFEQMEGRAKSAGTGIRDSFLGNLAAGAVQEFTRQIVAAGGGILEFSARLEQTKIGFNTLMGSSQAAEKHLKDLAKFASATPFEFESLTTASRRLQNVGLEGSKVIPILTDIGNAAAAAGASSAELDSITLAFSQIIAKGKVSAEEVNQLAERGIPVWKLLSEQLGKTKGEIIDLAEKGKISSDVFLQAFSRFSQMNFGDAMEKQSHTFSGAMSSIKDTALIVSTEAFKPFFAAISSFADDIATSLGQQTPKAQEAGASFGEALGFAIGSGLRRSEVGNGGWWDILFPIGWVQRKATELGESIGKGIATGYTTFDKTATNASGTYSFDEKTGTLVTGTPNVPQKQTQAPLSLDTGPSAADLKKAQDEIAAAWAKLNDAQRDGLEASFKNYNQVLKQQLEEARITGDNYRTLVADAEERFTKHILGLIGQEYDAKRAAAKNAVETKAINLEEVNERTRIDNESKERIKKAEEDVTAHYKSELEKRQDAQQTDVTISLDQLKRLTAVEEASLKKKLALGELTKPEYDELSYQNKLKLLTAQKALALSLQEFSDVSAEIKVLEAEREEKRATATAEELKDLDTKIEKLEKIGELIKNGGTDPRAAAREADRKARLDEYDRVNGTVDGQGGFANFRKAIEDNLSGDQMTGALAGLEAMATAFDQVGQAVGAAVQAFVLYGNAGASVRKVTAQIIASIAQQAAVKAVWELAEGFAMLATNFFWPDPRLTASATMHFHAAAIYGGLAVGAALVGRAVAGDSFKSQTSTAGGGSSGGPASRDTSGQGQAYSRYGGEQQVLSGSRNAPARSEKRIVLAIDGPAFLKFLQNDYDNNGTMREIVVGG